MTSFFKKTSNIYCDHKKFRKQSVNIVNICDVKVKKNHCVIRRGELLFLTDLKKVIKTKSAVYTRNLTLLCLVFSLKK